MEADLRPGRHVTVCVPVRDRRERMLRCLDAILALDYPSYDVLVLDNGSTDGTAQACRERAAGSAIPVSVRHIDGLIGRVRNAGARSATGEIVAFTDSDCLPRPDWLKAAARAFEDPSVGIVTGATIPEQPPPYGAWSATQLITSQSWRFETCNALYRRSALLESDGFDETVTMWEDTVAGWSVLRRGWRAVFAADAIVLHDVTYPGWLWHVRRVMRYGEGAGLLRRYPEMAEQLLWHRFFLAERDARLAASLAGLLLAPLRRRALLLTLPYLHLRAPRAISRGALRDSVQAVVFDGAILAGALRGSLRGRRLLI